MPADWTISKTGLSTTEHRNWNDGVVDRIIAWARATYLNTDGTQPGPNAALNRAMKAAQQGMKDATEKWEHDGALAAVPPPEEIPMD